MASDVGGLPGNVAAVSGIVQKRNELRQVLWQMGWPIGVAYSGGVDSSLVLSEACDVLGANNVVALLAVSPVYAQRELEFARQFVWDLGAELVEVGTRELQDERFSTNRADRCFFCKTEMFDAMTGMAEAHGLVALADGTQASDNYDFRPGRKATVAYGVRSPLLEAGLTKEDIRSLSQDLALPTWNKPEMACLASRFPYGMTITEGSLRQIEEAEAVLFDMGLSQVRVRHHDDVARIEVPPEEMHIVFEKADVVVRSLKGLGYSYVTLDLGGYRSGNMNVVGPDTDTAQ